MFTRWPKFCSAVAKANTRFVSSAQGARPPTTDSGRNENAQKYTCLPPGDFEDESSLDGGSGLEGGENNFLGRAGWNRPLNSQVEGCALRRRQANECASLQFFYIEFAYDGVARDALTTICLPQTPVLSISIKPILKGIRDVLFCSPPLHLSAPRSIHPTATLFRNTWRHPC